MLITKSACCDYSVRMDHVGEDDDPIRELFCNKCNKICEIKEHKSLCCDYEMQHVPDNIHFHYQCIRCCKEFELDGITERKSK